MQRALWGALIFKMLLTANEIKESNDGFTLAFISEKYK
jgi:hypothetical protein